MRNKKALSQIVSAVLLITLTISAIAIIGVTLQTFVIDRLDSAGSCYGVLDKVKFNNDWTCYNQTSNEMQFSIEVGDIDVESVLISVSMGDSSIIINLKNETTTIENVTYLDRVSNEVSLPSKEGGKTYLLEGVDEKPVKILIAPYVGTKQCDVSDRVDSIFNC